MKNKLITITIFSALAFCVAVSCKGNTTQEPIKDIADRVEATDTTPQYEADTIIDTEAELRHKQRVFDAFCWVESNFNCLAKSRDGKYIGCAQIGMAMVRLANEIAGEDIYTPKENEHPKQLPHQRRRDPRPNFRPAPQRVGGDIR